MSAFHYRKSIIKEIDKESIDNNKESIDNKKNIKQKILNQLNKLKVKEKK
jgi:hypothetical protein